MRTTKEYYSDIGLYYFLARWYARWLGSFVSPDPGGEQYAYAGGNPISQVDPTGLKLEPVGGVQCCTDEEAQEELADLTQAAWIGVREEQIAGGSGLFGIGCTTQSELMYSWLGSAVQAGKCWECTFCVAYGKGVLPLTSRHQFIGCRRKGEGWSVVFDSWHRLMWFTWMPELTVASAWEYYIKYADRGRGWFYCGDDAVYY